MARINSLLSMQPNIDPKIIQEMDQKFKDALKEYEVSLKDREEVKKIVQVRDEVLLDDLNRANLPEEDPLERADILRKKVLESSNDLGKIEEIIQDFVSEELEGHLEGEKVSFDGYVLAFFKLNTEDEKISLQLILESFYDFKLIFKFHGCNFGDVKLAYRGKDEITIRKRSLLTKLDNAYYVTNPIIELSLSFKNCTFGDVTCRRLIFKKHMDFIRCKFQEEADLSRTHFHDKANFSGTQFHQEANFFGTQFHDKANFSGASFGEKTNQSSSLELKGEVSKDVERSKNQKEIHPLSLSGSINETNLDHLKQSCIADFSKSKFEKMASFSEVRFYCDANFKHATFEHVSFTQSHFYQVANFYCAKSSGVFDFSFSIFHQRQFSNFVGVNPLCSFERLEEYLRAKNQNQIQRETMFGFSLDIRDSFRNIKEILTVQTNTLDAQNWHVMELYAKELELKIEDEKQPEKQNKPSNKEGDDGQDLKKGEYSNYWRRKIDQIQLWFYRSISDHHTDLLKIVGHVLSAIGLFGTLLFACRYGLDIEKFFNNHPENVLFVCMKSIPNLILKFLLSVLYGLMIGIWLFKIVRFVLEIFLSLNIFKVFSKLEALIDQFLWIFFIVSLIVGLVFVGCWGLNVCLFCYLAIAIFTGWILLLFRIVLRKEPFHIVVHYIEVFVSSLIASVIISVNPKYILGVGSLFGGKTQGVMENFIVVAYSIIMLLLLFSLQKTARKNSIFHG